MESLLTNFLLIFLIFFAFLGCGDNSLYKELNISLPSNITITLPRKLEPNHKMLTALSNKSYTYETMQSKIIGYRDKSMNMQNHIHLLRKILPSINKICQDTPSEVNCSIAGSDLPFKLTPPELRNLRRQYRGEIAWDIDKPLYFGDIIYKHYQKDEQEYSLLEVDLLPFYQSIKNKNSSNNDDEDKHIKQQQTVVWTNAKSDDVLSILEENSKNYKEKIQTHYLKNQKGEALLQAIYESSSTLYGNFINKEFYTFIQNNDINNSYTFKLDSLSQYTDETSVTHQYGQLSDKTGFHVNSASNNSQIIVFFDQAGTELGQYGCGSYDECTLEDKISWNNGNEFENNASILDKKFQLNIRNIRGTANQIKEGRYLLFSPKTEPTNLSTLQKELKSIGNFIVFQNNIYGVLYDLSYANYLNTIQVNPFISNEQKNQFIIEREIKE